MSHDNAKDTTMGHLIYDQRYIGRPKPKLYDLGLKIYDHRLVYIHIKGLIFSANDFILSAIDRKLSVKIVYFQPESFTFSHEL